jgi:hypothetical protein
MRAETAPQVVIDNERALLVYHPEHKIVHHELRTVVQGEEFRQILEKGLELFIQFQACKWLSDDRGNGPLSPEDSEWAVSNWSPRVIAAGWKYWAIVMPEQIMGKMDMTRWIKSYGQQGVTVSAFTLPGTALKWLTSR